MGKVDCERKLHSAGERGNERAIERAKEHHQQEQKRPRETVPEEGKRKTSELADDEDGMRRVRETEMQRHSVTARSSARTVLKESSRFSDAIIIQI